MKGSRSCTTNLNTWGREAIVPSFQFLSATQEKIRSLVPRFAAFISPTKKKKSETPFRSHLSGYAEGVTKVASATGECIVPPTPNLGLENG